MSHVLMRRKYDEARGASRSQGYTTSHNPSVYTNNTNTILHNRLKCCNEIVMPKIRDHEEHNRRRIIGLIECSGEKEKDYTKPDNILDGCDIHKDIKQMSESERLENRIHTKTCLASDPVYNAHHC